MTDRIAQRRKTSGRRAENGHSTTNVEQPNANTVSEIKSDPLAETTPGVNAATLWQMPKGTEPVKSEVKEVVQSEKPIDVAPPSDTTAESPKAPVTTPTGSVAQPGREGFVPFVGHGWAFFSVGRDNVFVFNGSARFIDEDTTGKRLEARLLTEQNCWELTLKYFGDGDWKTITTWTMPRLAEQRYVETWMTLPAACFHDKKQDMRLKVRLFKSDDTTYDGRMIMRLIWPALTKEQGGNQSNIPV